MLSAREHRLAAAVMGVLVIGALATPRASAEDRVSPWPSAERPAWPTSPYHGVTDGNGLLIPCRCRFQDHEYRLGEEVCMSTHLGVVMTRCDLLQNNTSWVPTATPCTISRAPEAREAARVAARR